jgi:hypothetical protein
MQRNERAIRQNTDFAGFCRSITLLRASLFRMWGTLVLVFFTD